MLGPPPRARVLRALRPQLARLLLQAPAHLRVHAAGSEEGAGTVLEARHGHRRRRGVRRMAGVRDLLAVGAKVRHGAVVVVHRGALASRPRQRGAASGRWARLLLCVGLLHWRREGTAHPLRRVLLLLLLVGDPGPWAGPRCAGHWRPLRSGGGAIGAARVRGSVPRRGAASSGPVATVLPRSVRRAGRRSGCSLPRLRLLSRPHSIPRLLPRRCGLPPSRLKLSARAPLLLLQRPRSSLTCRRRSLTRRLCLCSGRLGPDSTLARPLQLCREALHLGLRAPHALLRSLGGRLGDEGAVLRLRCPGLRRTGGLSRVVEPGLLLAKAVLRLCTTPENG